MSSRQWGQLGWWWPVMVNFIRLWVWFGSALPPPRLSPDENEYHMFNSLLAKTSWWLQEEPFGSLVLWWLFAVAARLCFEPSNMISYLVASMALKATWSFGLALLDTYALMKKRTLHSPVLVSLFVVGDWVTRTLSLSAASACAGITILYFDAGVCKTGNSECAKFQFSVVLAFLSWVMIQTSSLIMFWLLASPGNFDVFSVSIYLLLFQFIPHKFLQLVLYPSCISFFIHFERFLQVTFKRYQV